MEFPAACEEQWPLHRGYGRPREKQKLVILQSFFFFFCVALDFLMGRAPWDELAADVEVTFEVCSGDRFA